MKKIKSNKGITNATVILIVFSIILVLIACFVIVYINNKNNQEIPKNGVDINKLSDEQKDDYSSEIQFVLDYAKQSQYVNINEKSAEQLVAFSHQNGIGVITNIDCFGMVEYSENNKTIYAWTILLYGEQGTFKADVSEEDGVIYNITYNDKVYYTKDKQLNIDIDENNENPNFSKIEGVDWSDLKIKINGIEYIFPYAISDFINDGWEPYSDYNQQLLEENISVDGATSISLKHSEYSCELNIYAENNALNEIKGREATIKELQIGQWSGRDNPLFEFYGIKAGDTKETAEKIFGTPENIKTDESRGYIEYIYNTTLKDETSVELILEFNINNELYEIEIKQHLNED